MSCFKCNEPVVDIVACNGGRCSGSYHYHCAGVTESTYRKMNQQKKSAWRCVLCRESQNETLAELVKEIKEFRADFVTMKDNMLSIKEDLHIATQNISDLNSKWSEMVVRVDGMDERLLTVERKVATIATVQKQLTDTQRAFDELKQENNNQDQFSRLNNVEIQGIPKKNGENLHSIFYDICTKVGVTLLDTDIDIIHRVQPFRGEGKTDTRHPSIIVRFTQRQRKNQLMAAVRARRGLTTADIGMSGAAINVYVNEHLTPVNKLLLKRARDLKTSLNYTYLWIRDCKIFLRKNDKSAIIRVANESDLSKLR